MHEFTNYNNQNFEENIKDKKKKVRDGKNISLLSVNYYLTNEFSKT